MNISQLLLASSAISRLSPVKQSPLPPFDQTDSGGIVHTVPPPELVIPNGPDPMFMRADFNGVTLPISRWGVPPLMIGANTTPVNMLMTPMGILYPRKFQDAMLTEHAERGYTHFVIAPDGWDLAVNGFNMTPAALISWAQYIKSWGFYIVLWQSDPNGGLQWANALASAGLLDWFIPGEEVDRKVTAQQYNATLQQCLNLSVPIGAHFTSNYPSGFPGDTFFDGTSMPSWGAYDGKVHLMWQADQNNSAGMQAARLYYARQRVNLGMISPDGGTASGAPNSRVYAFETMATKQLYGQCDEAYGNLRSLELLYATRGDVRIRPMAGYGNGCRLPDGSAC